MKKNIKKILILGLNNIGKKIAQKLKKKISYFDNKK